MEQLRLERLQIDEQLRQITQSHRPSDRGAYTEGTSNAPSSSRPYNVRGRRGRGHSYSTGYGTNSEQSNASETESERKDELSDWSLAGEDQDKERERGPRPQRDGRRRPGPGRGRGGPGGRGRGRGGYNNMSGSRDHEANYGTFETNTETDQTADTDASESNMSANRRRRSRRRRTDEDATLIDGMSESDNASVSENGIVTVADYISRAESESRQLAKKDPKKNKEVVEAIAEHSPQSEPATANGSNTNIAKASRSPSEKPAKVSYTGDDSPQPVVNGVS